MLTSKELREIREIADDWFPDICTIQTKTESVDALGGISLTWANTYVRIPCRLDPISGSEEVTNSALEAVSMWTLNIKYTQAISVEDRIVHDSKTYEVKAVWDTHSYKTIRRAQLIRIN